MGQLISDLCDSNTNTSTSIPIKENPITISKNDFEIINTLGEGAFGNVYCVQKKSNSNEYAMKVISKKKLQHGGLDLQMVVEKNILLQNKHPFLLNLKYSFQSSKNLYLVLDYCQGGDLYSYIQLFQILGISQQIAKFICAEVLLGLEYLNSKMKVIYRDLKPENILICGDGHLKIADFGLAKQLNDKSDKAKEVCGTLEYLAPEMVTLHFKTDFPGYGTEVDIWAFGIFLYETIVGVPPYTHPKRDKYGIMKQILLNQVNYPSYLNEDAKELISKCLSSDPSSRPSWEEIKSHQFFNLIDWEKMYNKEIESPIRRLIQKKQNFKKQPRPIIETHTEVFQNIEGFDYIPQT